MTDGITIRRASPRDVGKMVVFMNRSRRGKPKIDRAHVLESFGEHGYMLAEVDGELHAAVGWHTEDFIARIRQVTIFPARLRRTGQKVCPLFLRRANLSAIYRSTPGVTDNNARACSRAPRTPAQSS